MIEKTVFRQMIFHTEEEESDAGIIPYCDLFFSRDPFMKVTLSIR